jgi:CRISPR-associated protein Cas4
MMEEKITGIMIYYYLVCQRKLWLFYNNISMEDENELVQIGKFIDNSSYSSKRKHIMINEEINIDFVENSGVIHEIKKSRNIEEASIWQIKYYLYYLKKYGVENIQAKIDYPLLKQTLDVKLETEDEVRIVEIISSIRMIIQNTKIPPCINNKICKKCAYFDLCMI